MAVKLPDAPPAHQSYNRLQAAAHCNKPIRSAGPFCFHLWAWSLQAADSYFWDLRLATVSPSQVIKEDQLFNVHILSVMFHFNFQVKVNLSLLTGRGGP
jgi:hypothetical protein